MISRGEVGVEGVGGEAAAAAAVDLLAGVEAVGFLLRALANCRKSVRVELEWEGAMVVGCGVASL